MVFLFQIMPIENRLAGLTNENQQPMKIKYSMVIFIVWVKP